MIILRCTNARDVIRNTYEYEVFQFDVDEEKEI